MNRTGKVILSVGAFALIVAGLIYYLDRPLPESSGKSAQTSPAAAYFEERLTTLGIEDVGLPIEGFDSNILIIAFPGLIPADFDNVEALGGKYEVQSGTLEFIQASSSPISSADRTIAHKGYETLLVAVSKRLGKPARSDREVDAVIAAINTAERIETRIGEGKSALGVRIVPEAVLEDSRCPVDVQCIQAGTVRVRAALESASGKAQQTFVLDQKVTTEAEEIVLVRVEPEAKSTTERQPSDYRFYFEITKRNP